MSEPCYDDAVSEVVDGAVEIALKLAALLDGKRGPYLAAECAYEDYRAHLIATRGMNGFRLLQQLAFRIREGRR